MFLPMSTFEVSAGLARVDSAPVDAPLEEPGAAWGGVGSGRVNCESSP